MPLVEGVMIEAARIRGGKSPAFEYLRGRLPVSAFVIDRMEIDVPKELRYAEARIGRECMGKV